MRTARPKRSLRQNGKQQALRFSKLDAALAACCFPASCSRPLYKGLYSKHSPFKAALLDVAQKFQCVCKLAMRRRPKLPHQRSTVWRLS
jgi:hypothetical protein